MWRSFRCDRGQGDKFSAKTMIDLIKVIEPKIQSWFLARLQVRQDFAISEMLQISTVHDYSALKDYFLAYSKTKAAKIYLFLANSDSTAAQCETELCRAKSRSQSREKSQACCEEANWSKARVPDSRREKIYWMPYSWIQKAQESRVLRGQLGCWGSWAWLRGASSKEEEMEGIRRGSSKRKKSGRPPILT